MPTVPVAQPSQTLSGERVRNTATATPDAFGARSGRDLQGVGRAGGQASGVLAQHAQLFQQRHDEEAVRQAFVDYDTRMRSMMFDPEAGLMMRTGRNAAGVSTEALRTMEDAERQVGKTLNARQSLAFRERVMRVREGHLNNLARHESVEFRKAEEETLNAVLGSAAESAIAAARSPELRDEYLAQGETEIGRIAALHGWDDDVQQRKVKEYRTTVHKGIVERLLVNDPSGAREYYEALDKDQVDGTVMAQLEGSLRDGVTRQRAQEVTDRIVSSTRDTREMLRMARETTDPELRDEVVRRVNARISEDDTQRRRDQNLAAESAWSFVVGQVAGGVYPQAEDIPGFDRLAAADGQAAAGLLNWLDSKRRGDDPETNESVYLNFMTAPVEALRKYEEADIQKLRPQLSESDWHSVRTTWIKAKNAEPAELPTIVTIDQAAKTQATRFGITDTKKKDYALFLHAFREEVDRRLQASGSERLSQTEYAEIGAELAMEAERKRKWWTDEDVPVYRIRTGDIDFDIDDAEFEVPEDVAAGINAQARARGVTLTPEQVRAAYVEFLKGAR